jgi:hypothetical protein
MVKLLHVTVALQAALIFVQSISAGLLKLPFGHVLHSAGSYTLWLVTVAHVVIAILMWRPGGGSPEPIWFAAGFLALITAQVYIGVFHLTVLHIPFGTALLVASVLYLLRTRRLAAATATAAPAATAW